MAGDIHVFDGKSIKDYIDSTIAYPTGTVSHAINYSNDNGETAPTAGTIGTVISCLDYPDGSKTGQKFEFDVPDDYDSGALEVLAVWKPKGAVSGAKYVRIETSGEIADVSGNDVDTFTAANTDLSVPSSSTSIYRSVLKTLAAGLFGVGDHIVINVNRLATDDYTDDWQLAVIQYRYTGKQQTRAATESVDAFEDTDETPPGEGSIGTLIQTLDFAVDEEEKCTLLVPDNWDEISDLYFRLTYAMSSAQSGKTVRLATEGEIANVSGGTVDTLAVQNHDLYPANDTNVPHRPEPIRIIPAASLHKGDQITLKLARRTAPSNEHGGDFRLVTATSSLSLAPISGFSEVVKYEHLLQFSGVDVVSGSPTHEGLQYPAFGASGTQSFRRMMGNAASDRMDMAFEGRVASNQTKVTDIGLTLKGVNSPSHQLKFYKEGSGTAFHVGTLTATPSSATDYTVNEAQFTNPPGPDAGKRYWVVVEGTMDASDELLVGIPYAKQE